MTVQPLPGPGAAPESDDPVAEIAALDALALGAPIVAPPAGARERILAAVRVQAKAARPTADHADHDDHDAPPSRGNGARPRLMDGRPSPSPVRAGRHFLTFALAAALLLAVGLAGAMMRLKADADLHATRARAESESQLARAAEAKAQADALLAQAQTKSAEQVARAAAEKAAADAALAQLRAESEARAKVAALLADPAVPRVALAAAGAPPGTPAVGTAVYDAALGEILVFDARLAAPEAGRVLVFWYLPEGGGAPVNAGRFEPDPLRGAAHVERGARPLADVAGVAISSELDPTVTAPTVVVALGLR